MLDIPTECMSKLCCLLRIKANDLTEVSIGKVRSRHFTSCQVASAQKGSFQSDVAKRGTLELGVDQSGLQKASMKRVRCTLSV